MFSPFDFYGVHNEYQRIIKTQKRAVRTARNLDCMLSRQHQRQISDVLVHYFAFYQGYAQAERRAVQRTAEAFQPVFIERQPRR